MRYCPFFYFWRAAPQLCFTLGEKKSASRDHASVFPREGPHAFLIGRKSQPVRRVSNPPVLHMCTLGGGEWVHI